MNQKEILGNCLMELCKKAPFNPETAKCYTETKADFLIAEPKTENLAILQPQIQGGNIAIFCLSKSNSKEYYLEIFKDEIPDMVLKFTDGNLPDGGSWNCTGESFVLGDFMKLGRLLERIENNFFVPKGDEEEKFVTISFPSDRNTKYYLDKIAEEFPDFKQIELITNFGRKVRFEPKNQLLPNLSQKFFELGELWNKMQSRSR